MIAHSRVYLLSPFLTLSSVSKIFSLISPRVYTDFKVFLPRIHRRKCFLLRRRNQVGRRSLKHLADYIDLKSHHCVPVLGDSIGLSWRLVPRHIITDFSFRKMNTFQAEMRRRLDVIILNLSRLNVYHRLHLPPPRSNQGPRPLPLWRSYHRPTRVDSKVTPLTGLMPVLVCLSGGILPVMSAYVIPKYLRNPSTRDALAS